MNTKKLKILKWTTKILALLILLFGLPFYFGYGNPLPFVNPDYTLLDNLWLTAFPIIFIGLALGWKWEKLGGYLTIIPITISFIFGLITKQGLPGPMFVPFIVGVLYLISGYLKKHTSLTKNNQLDIIISNYENDK